MPFLKNRKNALMPRWKELGKLTHRNGYRAAVFGHSTHEKYTGWFKDNMKHGKGYQTYEDGTFYEGNWAFDKRNGHGYLSFVCPTTKKMLRIYTGSWEEDFPSAEGMKSFPDGGMYRGDFKLGKRHGWGCMFYVDGGIYTGHWVKDKRHGVGRYINHETKNFYEGSFKNDMKCGLGRYHHIATGQVQEGVWYDDLPAVTVMRDESTYRANAPKPTEFEIPRLQVLKEPFQVYLQRAHEVLDQVKEVKLEPRKEAEAKYGE